MYSSRFSCAIKVAFIFNMYLKELRKKTLKKCDGTSFVASTYGWANEEKKIDGVEYEINKTNIILSAIFSETIVIPLVLTAVELWEPVSYTEPSVTK